MAGVYKADRQLNNVIGLGVAIRLKRYFSTIWRALKPFYRAEFGKITGSPLKLTIIGHDFTCSNMNCSGIQSFLFGVILHTAVIVVQYTFWQFLTPISSGFVRNPG
jgi:hypothetical protein